MAVFFSASNAGVSRTTLGLAGEYAVAVELCRRNIYAQLTLGNQKRTDLIVFSEAGKLARVEVEAKQGKVWPGCRGVSGKRAFLVFVDFADKSIEDRPDFYILTPTDWRLVVEARVKELKTASPHRRVTIDSENIPSFLEETSATGRGRVGTNIRIDHVLAYREKWRKVFRSLGAT